jgi:hypothetical protein
MVAVEGVVVAEVELNYVELNYFYSARSSVGQSVGLRNPRSGVQVPPGTLII